MEPHMFEDKQSPLNITLQFDFKITPELVELYRQSSHDPFIGYDTPLSSEQAYEKLKLYALTKKYGKFERLAIVKILKAGELVGFCLPRKIEEQEYRSFKITDDESWYRIGTIYIDKQYRGQRITAEVVRLFKLRFTNIVWQCEAVNFNSAKAAESSGLIYSHHLYFKDSEHWSFEKDDEFEHGYIVFKSKLKSTKCPELKGGKNYTIQGLIEVATTSLIEITETLKDIRNILVKNKTQPPLILSVAGMCVDLNEVVGVSSWHFQISPERPAGIRILLKNGKHVDSIQMTKLEIDIAISKIENALNSMK